MFTAASRALLLRLGECCLCGFSDFFRRHIANMRGKGPRVTKRITHHAVAVAPEHVLSWHDDGRASLLGALDGGVAVFNVLVYRHRRSAQRLGRSGLAIAELRKV